MRKPTVRGAFGQLFSNFGSRFCNGSHFLTTRTAKEHWDVPTLPAKSTQIDVNRLCHKLKCIALLSRLNQVRIPTVIIFFSWFVVGRQVKLRFSRT